MDLATQTKPELIKLCKELKIKNYSNKKKIDLINLIIKFNNGANDNGANDNGANDNGANDNGANDNGANDNSADSENIVLSNLIPSTANLNDANPIDFLSNIQLYCNDCIEEMKNIASDSIELILCDLPYGSTKCKWDKIINIEKLWIEYRRILKKPSGVIVLFGQQPFTTKLISGNYDWFKYVITWKKNKTTQFLLANYRPMKSTEDIIIFSPGGAAAASKKTGNMTYNPQGLIQKIVKKKNSQKRIGKMLNQEHHLGKNNKLISNSEYQQEYTNYPKDIIEFNIESSTIHETQKPVNLLEYLIKTYSNIGNTVLDNTMGSGSTGIACLNTQRNFIGIEIETKYFDLATNRINAHINANISAHKY